MKRYTTFHNVNKYQTISGLKKLYERKKLSYINLIAITNRLKHNNEIADQALEELRLHILKFKSFMEEK